MGIVETFASRLQAKPSGKIPRAKNVYEEYGYPLMYIKLGQSGFWGLTARVVKRLNDTGDDWKAVLLETGESGYVLSKEFVNQMIESGALVRNEDGDYKFNESRELKDSKMTSFEGMRSLIHAQLEMSTFLSSLSNARDENEVYEKIRDLSKKNVLIALNALDEQFANPDRVSAIIEKFKRNSSVACLKKKLFDFKCQVCGFTFTKKDGTCYIEAAHIIPFKDGGPDISDNIAVLCPNHHKMLDEGDASAREVVLAGLGKQPSA